MKPSSWQPRTPDYAMYSRKGNIAVDSLLRDIIETWPPKRPTKQVVDFAKTVLAISVEHGEVSDTAVRDAMYVALTKAGIPIGYQLELVQVAMQMIVDNERGQGASAT